MQLNPCIGNPFPKILPCPDSEDPIDYEQILKHQFEGFKTINLFGQEENVPSDAQHFDVININV